MVVFKTKAIDILADGGKWPIGYITDETPFHSDEPYVKWTIWTFEMHELFTCSSLEECLNNIHILEKWWEENKQDYWSR